MKNIINKAYNWLRYGINPFIKLLAVVQDNGKYSLYVVVYHDLYDNSTILAPTIFQNLNALYAAKCLHTYNSIIEQIKYMICYKRTFKKYATNIL